MSGPAVRFVALPRDRLLAAARHSLAWLDRLSGALEAVIAERDELRDRAERLAYDLRDAHAASTALKCEIATLLHRMSRAVAELDAAPDADPEKPSKRAMREVLAANTRAWAVLTEGRDPPSKRRAEDAPRDIGHSTRMPKGDEG